jgi:hypothetical protein
MMGRYHTLAQAMAACSEMGKKTENLNTQNQDLSYLNLNLQSNLIPCLADRSTTINKTNLSNLSACDRKNPNKLTRRQLSDSPALIRLLDWGIDEPMIYVWAEDHGQAAMIRESNRLNALPDIFFKSQYGPVNGQKGRFFNKHMQELRQQKAKRLMAL